MSKPRSKSQMKANFVFFGKFLRHGTKIASFWPSSKTLARATVKKVDWASAQVIVELGAGTGPITNEVIKRLKPHTRFLAIERDPDFARILKERFADMPNVEIIEGDVRELDTILKARGIAKVDYFLSGLPTPSLPLGVRRRVFASVRRYMTPTGFYSNITEMPYVYWKYYKNIFKHVDFQFVAVNLPPAGVYHCQTVR